MICRNAEFRSFAFHVFNSSCPLSLLIQMMNDKCISQVLQRFRASTSVASYKQLRLNGAWRVESEVWIKAIWGFQLWQKMIQVIFWCILIIDRIKDYWKGNFRKLSVTMGTVECPVKSREERWMCTTNTCISDWGDKRACEGTDLDHPAWDRTLTDHPPSLPTLAEFVDDPFVVNFRSPVSHGQRNHYVEDLKGDFLHKQIVWDSNGLCARYPFSNIARWWQWMLESWICFLCTDLLDAWIDLRHTIGGLQVTWPANHPDHLSEKRVSEIKCFISRDFLNPLFSRHIHIIPYLPLKTTPTSSAWCQFFLGTLLIIAFEASPTRNLKDQGTAFRSDARIS